MPVFKYFTEEAHALAFIEKGQLLVRPLSYFRALEDGDVRGDRRDGILRYAPVDGLPMNMKDGRVIIVQGGGFNASVQQNDVFVFCASNEQSDALAKKFGRFCVEIDPECIADRLKGRASRSSALDYEQIISGNVDYRAPDKEPGIDWALPEKLVLIKPQSFASECEYRIAVGKRGTFNAENVGLTIDNGQPAPVAAPARDKIILDVGKLTDEAILHTF